MANSVHIQLPLDLKRKVNKSKRMTLAIGKESEIEKSFRFKVSECGNYLSFNEDNR